MKKITNIFSNYLNAQPIFNDKRVLQSSYMPDEIIHREKQMEEIARILAPALRNERPSNLFVYGKTGTGKTISIRRTVDELLKISVSQKIPLKVIYLNCKLKKVADTEYRLVAQIAREMGKAIPATGLPTEEVYKIFYNELDRQQSLFIIILDEIDQVVKKIGDELLYNLTRINSELSNSQICLIGISNDTQFTSYLDSRVKSSLSEEDILFPPYDALQLQDILRKRSEIAFKEGVMEPGVIEKCAAYAARDHGDARRALDLLRVSGELCERNGDSKITLKYLDEAENKIERDKVYDLIQTQPKQHQLTLYSILQVSTKRNERLFTGEVYEYYKNLCPKVGLRPLTQRRISDIIGEFDMLGIIYARIISKGRYGRTREITLSIPKSTCPKINKLLESELGLN